PLSRAYDDPDTLEEERRLFYVGITRAERKAYFTHARMRRRGGSFEPSIPLSFLDAIPAGLIEERPTEAVARIRRQMQGGYRRRSGGGGAGGAGREASGGVPGGGAGGAVRARWGRGVGGAGRARGAAGGAWAATSGGVRPVATSGQAAGP